MPVETSMRPVPSTDSSMRTFVSAVFRSTVALRPMGDGSHRGQEGVGLRGGAGGDPQPAVEAHITNQHAAIEQGLPYALGVLELSEEDEVGVAVHHGEAQIAQADH